jgi:hypothetical protein
MIVNVGQLPTASSRRLPGLSDRLRAFRRTFPTETPDAIGGNGDVAFTAPDRAKIKGRRGT